MQCYHQMRLMRLKSLYVDNFIYSLLYIVVTYYHFVILHFNTNTVYKTNKRVFKKRLLFDLKGKGVAFKEIDFTLSRSGTMKTHVHQILVRSLIRHSAIYHHYK